MMLILGMHLELILVYKLDSVSTLNNALCVAVYEKTS